jgi:hypothetical protein
MMNQAEELRHRIVLLANGKPSAIVTEMEKEIDLLQATVDRLPEAAVMAESVVKTVMMTVRSYRNQAETIGNPLSILERNIQAIESKPGIQRYQRLTHELNHQSPNSPAARRELRNQIQSLKATYSSDLSSLISYTQQSLVHRLNLIQCWKSLIFAGIGLFEVLRENLWKRIFAEAKSEGDELLLQFLREQQAMMKTQEVSEPSKLVKTTIQVANVKFLKVTLQEQLNEVVRLDSAISEKRECLHRLENVTEEMSRMIEAPTPSPKAPAAAHRHPPAPETTSSSDAGTPPGPGVSRPRRMVFSDKFKK